MNLGHNQNLEKILKGLKNEIKNYELKIETHKKYFFFI